MKENFRIILGLTKCFFEGFVKVSVLFFVIGGVYAFVNVLIFGSYSLDVEAFLSENLLKFILFFALLASVIAGIYEALKQYRSYSKFPGISKKDILCSQHDIYFENEHLIIEEIIKQSESPFSSLRLRDDLAHYGKWVFVYDNGSQLLISQRNDEIKISISNVQNRMWPDFAINYGRINTIVSHLEKAGMVPKVLSNKVITKARITHLAQ